MQTERSGYEKKLRIYAKNFHGVKKMRYKREKYLKKLISRMNNGRVKIVTGIRRSGKSYLLFELFCQLPTH